VQPPSQVTLDAPQLLELSPTFQVTLQLVRLQPLGIVTGTPVRNTLPGLQFAGRVVTQQLVDAL
jgi:hypothetical protein